MVRESQSVKRHHLSRHGNDEEEEAIGEREKHSKLKEQEIAWQELERSGWSIVNAEKQGRSRRGQRWLIASWVVMRNFILFQLQCAITRQL